MKKTLAERAKLYMKENEALMRKYSVRVTPTINFPRHRKLPWYCRIALNLISIGGAILDMQFTELNVQ